MKSFGGFLSMLLAAGLTISCADADEPFSIFSSAYDFSDDMYGWSADFADYKPKDSLENKLNYSFSNRPSTIALYDDQKSIMLSGNNKGENLFMFIKKKIGGLKPNKDYTVVFEVEFGSSVSNTLDAADSVYLKVGAITEEPKKIILSDYYRLNIDKGLTSENGEDMTVIGALSASEFYNENYTLVKKSNFSSASRSIAVRTNDDGEAWLIVGTDTAFKGSITLYYTTVNVVFSASK